MSETNFLDSPVAQSQLVAVVRLYDTALGHIDKAAASGKNGDFDTQLKEVLDANRIFSGLDGCLDMTTGGQTAANLRDLYRSVVRALLNSVGRTDDDATYEKLIVAVKKMRDAWAEIAGVSKTS